MQQDAMQRDYAAVQKILHWLMGIVIILDLVVAQKFGGFLEEAERLESRNDHATLGSILLVLFILRLYFRRRHGVAALPETMPRWQVGAARAVHFLLYFFIGALFLTGIATAANTLEPVLIFGQFTPTIGNMSDYQFQFVRLFHEFSTYAVIGLIAIHALATLYHAARRDGVLTRMLIFWRRTA